MSLPDQTNPRKSAKRRPGRHAARPASNGQPPAPRYTYTQDEPEDLTLFHRGPDKKLQHCALRWAGFALLTTSVATCVVAIAVGSVPVALVAAVPILAMAIQVIVRYAFPRQDKR